MREQPLRANRGCGDGVCGFTTPNFLLPSSEAVNESLNAGELARCTLPELAQLETPLSVDSLADLELHQGSSPLFSGTRRL